MANALVQASRIAGGRKLRVGSCVGVPIEFLVGLSCALPHKLLGTSRYHLCTYKKS